MNRTTEFKVEKSSQPSFAPLVLIRDVFRKWFLIFVVAVVAGIGAYIFTDWNYSPRYQTNATLVITTRDSTTTVFSNLQSTSELAAVFTGLLNSSAMQKVVLEEVGLNTRDCSIAVSVVEGTNLLTMQVTASDPTTAFLVISSLIENHGIVTYEVIGDIVVEVLQLPTVPTAPANSPATLRWVSMVMLLAAAAAGACVVMFSCFRNTICSRSEAEHKLDCWCLGEIHHEKKYKTLPDLIMRRKSSLVITNPSNSFRFLETVRRLRRRVEQYMGSSKVLMITSVMENEGKSTIAVNLALSLAQKHSRVLLIDLDLYKPGCYKILDHKDFEYNTSDVLSGSAVLSQAVVREPLSGLSMILERMPSGNDSGRGVSSVSHEKIAAVIAQARENYDYVILDLPPMSAASDAEYIMEHADSTLMVVQQNQVGASVLNRAIDALQKGRAQLLGCVLNNVYSMSFLSGHEGGYGYGYGRYGAYGKYDGSGTFSPVKSKDAGR